MTTADTKETRPDSVTRLGLVEHVGLSAGRLIYNFPKKTAGRSEHTVNTAPFDVIKASHVKLCCTVVLIKVLSA